MDRQIAEYLIGELGRHSVMKPVDSYRFIKVLANTDVPESSKFYEELPDVRQVLHESDQDHEFSLRRVLRNANARDYKLSTAKRVYEAMLSGFGIYSSDVLSRRLRSDADIMEMMAESEYPFSLLGKVVTEDNSNPKKRDVRTRPILVIPGAKDQAAILEWECSNTIKPREFLSLLDRPEVIDTMSKALDRTYFD